jgi:hypothetical protein
MFNLENDNDILVEVPPGKSFPNGFFYTTDTDFIEVIDENEVNSPEILEKNDPNRLAYINKLNCKNLIISRIKNENHYDSLLDNHIHSQETGAFSFRNKLPKSLNSTF